MIRFKNDKNIGSFNRKNETVSTKNIKVKSIQVARPKNCLNSFLTWQYSLCYLPVTFPHAKPDCMGICFYHNCYKPNKAVISRLCCLEVTHL